MNIVDKTYMEKNIPQESSIELVKSTEFENS